MAYSYLDGERIIASVKPTGLGIRPAKIEIEDFAADRHDIYFNGLNLAASGSLYLTGSASGMFTEVPIGIDGLTGEPYVFEYESEFSVKVPDVAIGAPGTLDAIYVDDGVADVLTQNYEYGFHGIDVQSLY